MMGRGQGLNRPALDETFMERLPEATSTRTRRAGRRRWWVAAVLVLAASVAGCVWLLVWWPSRRDAQEVRELVSAGRFEEAEGPLRRWLSARPESAEAHALAARVALGREQPQRALEEAAESLRLGSPPAAPNRIVGILKSRAGLYFEAEPLLLQALAMPDVPDPEVAEALAHAYVQTFRLAAARQAIERWRRDAPDDPEPYLLLAQIGHLVDEPPSELVGYYQDALKRDPKNFEARLGLAEWLLADHHDDEAAAQYAEAIALRPDDPRGHLGAGRVAFQRGKLDEAAREFDRALALDPELVEALRERAAVDLAKGQAAPALERLDRAIALDPHSSELRYRRAMALRGLGRLDEADEAQQEAARLQAEDKRMDEIRRDLLKSPGDVDLMIEAIRWMLRRGQEDEALKWVSLVLRDHPGQPELHQLLAEYYEERGDVGRANFYRSSARPAK
jgi:tetratricopeptide (TPR) repeat protein